MFPGIGAFLSDPLIFSHLADIAAARVGLKWPYLSRGP